MRRKGLIKRIISGCMACAIGVTMQSYPAQTVSASVTNPVAELSVDMADEQGEIIHGAAGFLYGVSSEDVPTTNTMVPLKPKVLATKGALGTEHPYGDALDVAKTFLESGGEQVMMYNSNYYGVFGVTTLYKDYANDLQTIIAPAVKEWKEAWKEEHGTPAVPKDAIGKRVDIDEALIYIPVNEGTPNNGAKDFGVAWNAYYKAIKAGDPNATIAGTNDWYYNRAFGYIWESDFENPEDAVHVKDENGNNLEYNLDYFLPYCIENDCMPDIITWHELDADALIKMADHKADFESKWEKYWQAAIRDDKTDETEVPEVPQIVINEYATGYDCGVPGRLINWIARLEDNGMYGCLPFWHLANDLNDLAADANEGNASWWAFKWYGDMSGQRLNVESSEWYDELYGLATIDDNKKSAKVLFGGEDGSSVIVLDHVTKTETFKDAQKVHIKVEAASYAGVEGAEYDPPAIIEGTFPVDADGSVTVSLQDMKFSTAYCLTMTKASADAETEDALTSRYLNYYEAEEAQTAGSATVVDRGVYGAEYAGPTRYLSNDYAVLMKQNGELTYTIEVPADGRYELSYVYGNGTGTKRTDPVNSLSLNLKQSMQVDSNEAVAMTMENTLLTNNTGRHREYVDLKAGIHTIKLTSQEEGEILHDLLIVSYYGAYGQGSIKENRVYEAEHADFNTLADNTVTTVKTESKIAGYSGDGYVKGLTKSVTEGGGIRWNVIVEESGLYNLTLRYQSEQAGNADIYLGNTAVTLTNRNKTLALEASDGQWKTAAATIYLQKGINIVDVDADTDISLDYMQVEGLEQTAEVNAYTAVIEAEDCIPAGAENIIKVVDSEGASNGKYIAGLEGDVNAKNTLGKYLEFTYDAPEAGDYQMQVFQSNDEICGEHSYNTKIIDKYIVFSVADGNGKEASPERYFFINTFSRDTFKEKTIPLKLTKGKNTIRVYNDDSWTVKYGGTQSTPGEDVLDNYTPNLDRFIITPKNLVNAIVQEAEYSIDIRTTAGGYAVSDKNTVKEGESFGITMIPESGLHKVLVNGQDKTAEVTEGENGTYLLNIGEVKEHVEVQVYFSDVDTEAQDAYIKNAGFGTGTAKYWEAENVSVTREASHGYDGNHANMTKESALSQTVSKIPAGKYYLGVYSAGSEDAGGKVFLKATVGKNVYQKELNLETKYSETVFTFRIMDGLDVKVEVDTSGLTQGTVYLDNFSIKETSSRDTSKVDNSVLYFVDCGDHNINTLPDGEKFGTRNSITDQIYQVDTGTGYRWGLVTTEEDYQVDPWPGSNGAWTRWQYPEQWNRQDFNDKNATFRHTELQNGENGYTGDVKYVRYAFELSPGEYNVEVGFYNRWGSKWGGEVSMLANGRKAAEIPMMTDEEEPYSLTATQKVAVEEEDGSKLLLSFEKPSDRGAHYITYIKITDASENGDLSKIKELYALAEGYSNEDESYIKISWERFDAAREAAKGYALKDSISKEEQAEADKAAEELEAALEGLVKADTLVDKSLLYFVDCGDNDVRTVSRGSNLGMRNSITDQVFAADLTTGYEWGIVDSYGGNDGYVQGETSAKTRWINAQPVNDGSDKNDTFVFANGQMQSDEVDTIFITYKFQVGQDGVYPIELGLGNVWNCAANPMIYGNLGTEKQVTISDNINVPNNSHVTVKGEVEAVDGYITIDLRMAKEAGTNETINLNYITVGREKNSPAETGIEITAEPDKTAYEEGEELDLTGLAVSLVYDNGEKRELSNSEYSVSGYDKDQAGTQTITVSYPYGTVIYKAIFDVTVNETMKAALSGIDVTAPEKTEYQIGEEVNLAGMKVTAVYEDGSSSELEMGQYTTDVDQADMSTAGLKTITVSYEENGVIVTGTFEITVKEKGPEVPGESTDKLAEAAAAAADKAAQAAEAAQEAAEAAQKAAEASQAAAENQAAMNAVVSAAQEAAKAAETAQKAAQEAAEAAQNAAADENLVAAAETAQKAAEQAAKAAEAAQKAAQDQTALTSDLAEAIQTAVKAAQDAAKAAQEAVEKNDTAALEKAENAVKTAEAAQKTADALAEQIAAVKKAQDAANAEIEALKKAQEASAAEAAAAKKDAADAKAAAEAARAEALAAKKAYEDAVAKLQTPVKTVITTAKKKYTVKIGKKVKIGAKAANKNGAKITYKSSNKKVAKVGAKGVIRGVKKGTAKITIKCNGVKKVVRVRVK